MVSSVGRRLAFLIIITAIATFLPMRAHAQFWPSLGGRIVSRDGQWLVPVIGGLLSSNEDDHLQRGSVYAWDVSAPYSSFIFPMAAGKVSYAGCNNAGGYGCWVLIDHGDGYLSLYGHMIDEGGGTVRVSTGDRVSAWTPMGRVGWTGMTSFGPHVHWEIHHAERGRVRNDLFFSRSAISYCKFCSADGSVVESVATNAVYGGILPSRELWFAVALLLLGVTIFFRPEFVVDGVQQASAWVYQLFHQTQTVWQRSYQRRTVHWSSLVLAFLIPAFLCSTGTALAVWMADEQIDPRTLFAYFRFGLYPFPGEGYQIGAHYSAVWGIPCQGVGTLGLACEADEIAKAAVDWQQEVERFSRAEPIPVAIARLGTKFDQNAARRLLNEMHYNNGLAIIDVGSDFKAAHDVVDALTGFGLDGIAIDMEFTEQVRQRDIYWLAESMAEKRRAAGLAGKGVLVLWNVFHNVDGIRTGLDVEEIELIPIFTGYGPVETKLAGLAKTQEIFGVEPLSSGLMAFDQRWPINRRCKTFNTTLGFDCQDWRVLFANPAAASTGWWVQQ